MRMMTGAILILAHAMLYSVYSLSRSFGENPRDMEWLQWYSWAMAGLGGLFLLWGFVRDLRASQWRRDHKRARGDR
jgi:drug/metabolite transporter (DMT)-like permease